MADIWISRQDYRDAAQITASKPAQYNGWEANTISGALPGTLPTGYTSTVGTGGATIPADFKDHKTVFVINNAGSSAVTVTFSKGDSYQGVKDLVVSVPAGVNLIWLESAPFVDQKTGKITVTASANVTMYGYEMR